MLGGQVLVLIHNLDVHDTHDSSDDHKTQSSSSFSSLGEDFEALFVVEAVPRNLFRVLDVGAAEQGTFDHGMRNSDGSHDVDRYKRQRANDPQPLRTFDDSCVCACRFTLSELKGRCPSRQKGLFANLKKEAQEHGIISEAKKASKGVLWNCLRDHYQRYHPMS